jgi:hypothetical protein
MFHTLSSITGFPPSRVRVLSVTELSMPASCWSVGGWFVIVVLGGMVVV